MCSKAAGFRRGLRVPPLTEYIRGILQQYPDDGQILKELIQNADDAGATTVKFVLDDTQYDTDGLIHSGMQKFQGAALLLYNDAAFTEEDWDAICVMQNSIKKNDFIKTGRFGLGFKSIFHITDLPTILSGEYVGFIDPHHRYLPHDDDRARPSAYNWHFDKDKNYLQENINQFEPLFHDIFDSSSNILNTCSYDHTIFRFPLRNKTSDLSSTIYTAEKVVQLFNSLKQDQGQCLLFLKSVQCIELYHKERSVDEPKLLYSMKLGGNVSEVVEKRKQFLDQISREPSLNTDVMLKMKIDVVQISEEQIMSASNDWLVYHDYQADKDVLAIAHKQKVLPWIGIAFPLDRSLEELHTDTNGKLFATLPLPLDGTERTGLVFHIHAYFSMEQNRRHLRWPTADQDFETLDSALAWNAILVNKCIPSAVVSFYKRATLPVNDGSDMFCPNALYNLLPDPHVVDAKWKTLADHVYTALFEEPCFYTLTNPGIWVKPSDAILYPEEPNDQFQDLVESILIKAGSNVIKPPTHVRGVIRKDSRHQPIYISTSMVHDAFLKVTQGGLTLDRKETLLLLRYFLFHDGIKDLQKLPLIPLRSGKITEFLSHEAEHLFITSEQHPASLLPYLEDRIVDPNIDDELYTSLLKVAMTDSTQIQPLNFNAVISNLHHILPSEWTNDDVVSWLPDHNPKHPTMSWIQEIWEYIHQNNVNAEHWAVLDDIHLVPIAAPMRLAKLSVGKRIVVVKNGNDSLPDVVERFLIAIGVIILKDCLGFVHSNQKLLHRYVNLPTCDGVIGALIAHRLHNTVCFDEKMSECSEFVEGFLNYLSDSGVKHDKKMFLRCLPLFKTVKSSGFKPSVYVAIDEVKYSWPSTLINSLPVPCPEQVIDVQSEKVQRVLENLDVSIFHRSSFCDILTDLLIPAIELGKYTEKEVEDLGCYIMETHPELIRMNGNVAAKLCNIKFVKTRSNELRAPSDLYDPADSLSCTFLNKSLLPHEKYTAAQIDCLKSLQMKTSSNISMEDFISIAKSLPSNADNASAFIELTKSLHEKRPNEKWWQHLQHFAFLKAVPHKPAGYPKDMPWVGSNGTLLRPEEVGHITNMNQSGSVIPLVNLDVPILNLLGVNVKPGINTLVKQLEHITINYTVDEKTQYMLLLDDIYGSLEYFTAEMISKALQNCNLSKWIWTGNEFRDVKQVILDDAETDLKPYIVSLKTAKDAYKTLLSRCDVAAVVDLKSILKLIATKHESQNEGLKEDVCHDRQLAIRIANVLSQNDTVDQDILLPTETGDNTLMLRPARDCTVWDSTIGLDSELHMVHSSVPPDILTKLNVATVVQRELDGEEFGIGFESFGQSEPLTRRLKSILEGYTDGLAILKELIQNADDAGATDIQLIYDRRENKMHKTSLLDLGMAAWQGPCLWVYNNSVFTKQDFDNITKLNGATKMEKEDEIGAFGLGFNSVYNLTDIPSVLSGDRMAIFDPHTTFLGKQIRDKTKPGLRIPTNNKRTRGAYSDQFAPWNGICGCKLDPDSQDTTYNGTLFRLPLRGHNERYCSEISNELYDHEAMIELLMMIHDQGSDMLLCTQNVLNVSVTMISNNTLPSDAKQLFKIKKKPVDYLIKHGINCHLSSVAKIEDMQTQEFINECSILKAAAQCKGNQAMKSSFIIETLVTSFQYGKEILGVPIKTTQKHWLVSHCSKISISLAVQRKKRKAPAIAGVVVPLAGCTGHLTINSEENNMIKGSYFSFLPLPIKCPLPIHINGTFFLDQSRRHLVQKTDHDRHSEGGVWNQQLMEGAICDAYFLAMNDITNKIAPDVDLSKFLPWNKEDDLITSFSSAFWRKVIDDAESPKIFFSSGQSVSFHDSYFLDSEFLPEDELRVVENVISTVLNEKGKYLVGLTDKLQKTLKAVDDKLLEAKTITEEKFFLEFYLPYISKLQISPKNREIMLVKALRLKSDAVSNFLKNEPCIPVTPAGNCFACPKDLVDPTGKAKRLFSLDESRFPYFRDIGLDDEKFTFQRLYELGMVKDTLEWSDIAERVQSLPERLTKVNDKTDMVNDFLEYLNFKLADENEPLPATIHQVLKNEKILPVAEKPKDWNLKWKGESRLYKGSELYTLLDPFFASTHIPILEPGIKITDPVAKLLGITDGQKYPESIELVKKQLKEIASTQDCLRSPTVRDSLNRIYGFLEGECKDETKTKGVSNLLGNDYIVFIAPNNLVQPAVCALSLNVEAFPYLNKPHQELSRLYPKLMVAVGVKERFNAEDYVTVIGKVKEDYGNNPIPEDLLNKILEGFYTQLRNDRKILSKDLVVHIPDTNLVLQPVACLYFNDAKQVRRFLPYLLAHDNIPSDIVKWIELRSVRAQILLDCSDEISYEQNNSSLIDDIKSSFEQDRKLLDLVRNTDRCSARQIQNLTMLDLIHDADKSGAEEIHFILDNRLHSTDSIFSNKWKSLQGPSLCVHYDARTKKKNIKYFFGKPNNIIPSEFGERGIHSVFHLTDTPSILATLDDHTEAFCVYDPNCQYVKGTTKEEPGIRYKRLDLLKELFSDVFTCYPPTFTGKGTLLRLPLRMSDSKSSISPAVKTADIALTLNELASDALQILLFTGSLRKICITRIDRYGQLGKMDEITRKTTKGSELYQFMQDIKSSPQNESCNIAYEVEVQSSERTEKWSVVQQCGFNNVKSQKTIMIGGVAKYLPEKADSNGKDSPRNILINSFIPVAHRTKLDMCINGAFARRLSSGDDIDAIDECNNKMATVIASAYVKLITQAAKNLQTEQCEEYYAMFPILPKEEEKENVTISQSSDIEKLIVQKLYELLSKESVIPVTTVAHGNIKCVQPCEAIFIQLWFEDQSTLGLNEQTKKKLSPKLPQNVITGAQLCAAPLAGKCASNQWFEVLRMFQTYCDCHFDVLNAAVLMRFLKSPEKCNMTMLSTYIDQPSKREEGIRIVKAMLMFCKAEFNISLHLLPLLVTSNWTLKKFDNAFPVYKLALDLLNPCSPDFLHRELWEIFEDINNAVFKQLNLGIFCEELGNVLPQELIQNEIILFKGQFELKSDRIWKYLKQLVASANSDELLVLAGNYALIPVNIGGNSYLYPLGKANQILVIKDKFEVYYLDNGWGRNRHKRHRHKRHKMLPKVLERFTAISANVPILELEPMIDDQVIAMLQLANWDEAHTIIYALHVNLKENPKLKWDGIRTKILEYIEDKIHQLTRQIDCIKDLPIFECFNSTYVSITGKCTFAIPDDIPSADMDLWQTTSGQMLFLKQQDKLKRLHEAVKCTWWTNSDLYVQYIFGHLELLSDAGRDIHMKYVFTHLKDKSVVMDALRNIKCIKNIRGNLCLPSEVYDPNIELFRTMHENDLPAEDLRDLLPALTNCGMVCSVTKEMLALYATQIDSNPKRTGSLVILNYIKKLVQKTQWLEFLKAISHIEFIPRYHSLLTSICPDNTSKKYVSLKGNTFEKHFKLVSTVIALIPTAYTDGFANELLEEIGVITEPTCEQVAMNIKRLCENSQTNTHITAAERLELGNVINTCYSYINSIILDCKLETSQIEILKEILCDSCCIPIRQTTEFIKPNQLVLPAEPGEEIAGYLFRIPDHLICSKEILLHLGLHEPATIRTYQHVMSIIHAKVGRSCISTEIEIRAAKQATYKVFKRFQTDGSLDVHNDLWLLSTANCLCKADELLYSNNKAIEDRITSNAKILIDLDIKDMEYIVECFPESHRPRLLRKEFKEVVEDVLEFDTASQNIIQEHLASQNTMNGIERLVHHIFRQRFPEKKSEEIQSRIVGIQNAVSQIKVRIVQRLKTCIVNDKCEVVGTYEEKSLFGDSSKSIFYIQHEILNLNRSQVYLYKVLASLINDLSQWLFIEHQSELMVILSEDINTIQKRLDEIGIIRHRSTIYECTDVEMS